MLPLFSLGQSAGGFRALVAEQLGVETEDLLTTDLFLYPRMKATLLGAKEEFISSPRLDDLACVFCCMQGFLDFFRASRT
jgi:aspartyl aminopeptidase